MTHDRMQAKDITDQDMLRAILHDSRTNDLPAAWYRIARDHPEWPEKVILAKCRQLLKRGLITGCVCGCRGDFLLTDKGSQIVGEPPWESTFEYKPIRTETVTVGGVEFTATTFPSIIGTRRSER
jgi:hypothetical protein